MWTDNVTKSCKSNIKTQRKEWKGQQVRPIPYMFCHLRLIMKTEIKKQNCYFWRMTYDGMENRLERTMNGWEIQA